MGRFWCSFFCFVWPPRLLACTGWLECLIMASKYLYFSPGILWCTSSYLSCTFLALSLGQNIKMIDLSLGNLNLLLCWRPEGDKLIKRLGNTLNLSLKEWPRSTSTQMLLMTKKGRIRRLGFLNWIQNDVMTLYELDGDSNPVPCCLAFSGPEGRNIRLSTTRVDCKCCIIQLWPRS